MKKGVPLFVLLIALSIFFLSGCSGSDGAPGPAGTVDPGLVGPAVEAAAIKPESCGACHSSAGSDHQAYYDQLNKIGKAGIQVSNITYAYAAGTTTVTFKMTKAVPYAGANFDCREADNLNIYWVAYDGTTFPANPTFAAAEGRTSLKGTLTYNSATGVCTSTNDAAFRSAQSTPPPDAGDLTARNGIIAVYGYDEQVTPGVIPGTRVRGVKYPYAAIVTTGAGAAYASAANVAGCEKCHTVPYVKHGNILGLASSKEFYTCKVCHLDNGEGGHFEWKLTVEDPDLAASYNAGAGTPLTAAQEAQYEYKTTLMNDVHMSHAMEFPYPQSMSNCVVCHEGKIAAITADAKFELDTCKSCHPVTGSKTTGTDKIALTTLAGHQIPVGSTACNFCHKAGGVATTFSSIHSGYDKVVYAAPGKKYKDIFSVSIDSASLSGTDLTIKFKATKTDPTSATSLAVTDIVPTVIVGLYGYKTKDFIVDAHGSTTVNGVSVRNLEYVVGTTHPRFTTVSAAGGAWEVKASLADWAAKITDGTVKRIEIAVLPKLTKVVGKVDDKTNMEADSPVTKDYNVPVNSPSKTFDIATNAFVNYFSPIVKVAEGATVAAGGCDNCHAALGRTFHSAQYGTAGVVGCRLCHTTRPGGSHLEMQSRSIDSYVHAIHSFQPFDIQNIDFTDPFTAMEYKLETSSFVYPTFFTQNCKSCHNQGTFDVPDQYKSLGGTLSASRDTLKGKTRNITGVPSYVTGPGARACGSCHRTMLINKDDAGALAALSQHTKDNGYRVIATDGKVFDTVITKIMEAFK